MGLTLTLILSVGNDIYTFRLAYVCVYTNVYVIVCVY